MVYIHTERVKNLKVTWTYHDDRIIDTITFVDESGFRKFFHTFNLRYSLCDSSIAFANRLYRSFYLYSMSLKPLYIK